MTVAVCRGHLLKVTQLLVAPPQKYVLGNPTDPESNLGPMANVRFADKVRYQIQDAGKCCVFACFR